MQCYMCDEDAVNKEHVPPESFFLEEDRENLITVKSCEKHNNDNSNDVDYVRNIIASELTTNSTARIHFKEKIVRSWNRREGSFAKRVFKDSTPVGIINDEFPDGKITEAPTIEINRFNRIFDCMANAIYFQDFEEKFAGKWLIFFPNFRSQSFLTANIKGTQEKCIEEYLAWLESLDYIKKETAHPDVFQYFINQKGDNLIYKFLFYEGFVAYIINA